MQITLTDALFTEADFPRFNPQGFKRVNDAIAVAIQKKALASNVDELNDAAAALRAAGERRNAEQRLANEMFTKLREQIFQELIEAFPPTAMQTMPPRERSKASQLIDHLIMLYRQKEFTAIRAKLKKFASEPVPSPPKTIKVKAVRPRRPSQETRIPPNGRHERWTSAAVNGISITALFQNGLAHERKGQKREAAEIYRAVLDRNPRHFQALNRLELLNGRRLKGEF